METVSLSRESVLASLAFAENGTLSRKLQTEDGHPERNIFIKPRHPEFISGSVTILEDTPIEQPSKLQQMLFQNMKQ